MKKIILSCGLAALAATMLFAQNDKLVFFKNSEKVESVRVDDVKGITYVKDADPGFKSMKLDLGDNDPLVIDLDEFDRIDYTEGLPDNPLSVTVDPHHACATLHITTSDPDAYYRVAGAPVADLDQVPEVQWIDYLFEADERECQEIAASYGATLSDFQMESIFHKGDLTRDWWPTTYLFPDEEVALVFYTAKVEGNNFVLTSEPMLVKFRTKKAELCNTEYDVDVTFNSNTYTIKATAKNIEGSDRNIPFYIDLYTKEQIESSNLDDLTLVTLAQLEQNIYNSNKTWADAMYYTEGERTVTNTRVGDEMVAVVYGCEYGVITTPYFIKEFTVPVPEVTSDATFTVNATAASTSEYMLNVSPSDPSVKWTGMLIESSKIPDEYTKSKEVSSTIRFLNITSPSWQDRLVHQGNAENVSTQSGLIYGNLMSVGTEYSVLIFGIDDNGCVITEINETKITPQSQAADLSLELSFSDFEINGTTAHLTAHIVPSDKNAKYVFNYLPEDNACAQLDCTDEEFIERYVSVEGQYLSNNVYTGDLDKRMAMGQKYDSTLGMWKFGYYIAFAFGYDGEATSGLYAYRINAATGEAELLRAPEPQSGLSINLAIDNFRPNDSQTNFVDVHVTPSDKEAKYVLDKLPSSHYMISSNLSDEQFIADYVAVQGTYLSSAIYSGDLNKTFSMGQSWNNDLGMFEFGNYTFFCYGYDGEQTSDLLMFEVNGKTGEVTQLRGPSVTE